MNMRQRHLRDLAREIRALGRPIAEGRAEAMHGDIVAAHPLEELEHRHRRYGLSDEPGIPP
jgi:hypothetical protein